MKSKILFVCTITLLLMSLCISCKNMIPVHQELEGIPEDTGGQHLRSVLGSTDSPYGYYAYLPGGYEGSRALYPLLVFLHGSGEKGNSQDNPDVLDKVLVNGPPRMIQNGSWSPGTPMLVLSPQCHDGSWNPEKINQFIRFILNEYHVQESRIYITGLSMGGYGTFNYIGRYGDDSLVAAAVPICGAGNTSQAANFKNIPLWAFHGLADTRVYPSGSINMVEAINVQNPAIPAKLTLYPDVGHNSWTRTYTGSGMGQESEDGDPFDMDIFDWMLQFHR